MATSASPRSTAGSDSSGSIEVSSSRTCGAEAASAAQAGGTRRGGGRERGQRDPPRNLVAQRGQVGLGRVQPGEQRVGVRHQDQRGGGEGDSPPGPFGKSHSYLTFERGELLGYGGGRVPERGGGRGHRPVRG